MSMDEEFIKAYDLWSNFKEEVLYKNRFFIKHDVLDYIQHFAEKSQTIIEKNTILYRARLFTENDFFIHLLETHSEIEGLNQEERLKRAYYGIARKKDSGFWGYDEENSFLPINNDIVNDGRANPAFIKYLYTAEEPYTAIVEVRPYLESKVSVAEILVNEQLVMANFSFESIRKLEGFERKLMMVIMEDFSKPSDSNKKSYIPTQYISEYIKQLGLDGIRFNSSLHGRGRNITIFNFEKCQPIGSKLYEIADICFEAKGIAPKNEKELLHWKLEPYKEKQLDELIKHLVENRKQSG